MKHSEVARAASQRYLCQFETILEGFTSVWTSKANQSVTKVRWQPDCEPALAYHSSGLRLCTCAEFIFPFLFLLLLSACLISLHWFPSLIYFLLVLPISRDWVTVVICSNSYLQISLFLVHFLTHNWFSFPEGSVTWESRAFLSVTKVSLSDYPLAPFKTIHQMITQIFHDQSIISFFPSLTVYFQLFVQHPYFCWHHLSSGASSFDSPFDTCSQIPKIFLCCCHCFMQETLLLHFWLARGSLNTSSPPPLRTALKDSSWLRPSPSVCSNFCLWHWHRNEFTSNAKVFSEHWVFWLSGRYQNTNQVSSSPFLFVEQHVKTGRVCSGRDEKAQGWCPQGFPRRIEVLALPKSFSRAIHQHGIQTDAGDGPCCWPGLISPLHPGSLPLAPSGHNEHSQQKMVCLYLNAAVFPQWGKTVWLLQRAGLRNWL